jgi:hypothetical protein
VAGRACTEWSRTTQYGRELDCVDESTELGVVGPVYGRPGEPHGLILASDVSVTTASAAHVVFASTRVEPRSVSDDELRACPTR